MDGRWAALGNRFVERLWRTVKYEDVDIKGYASLPEHFAFYSGERPHPSLGYRTPADVHRAGEGGATATAFFLATGRDNDQWLVVDYDNDNEDRGKGVHSSSCLTCF